MTSSNSIPSVDSVWSGSTFAIDTANTSSYFTKSGELYATIGTDKYTVDLNEVYEYIQLLKHFMKEKQSPLPVPNWEAIEKHEILRKQWEDVVEACNAYRITEALLTGKTKGSLHEENANKLD